MDHRQTRALWLVALLGGLSFFASLLRFPADPSGFLQVAWSWFALVALTLWGGSLVVEQVVVQRREASSPFFDAARTRVRSLEETCAWLLLFSEAVTFALRAVQFLHTLPAQSFPLAVIPRIGMTTYGRIWLVREALILLALVLLRGRQRVQRQGNAQTAAGLLRVPSSRPRHLSGWKRVFSHRIQATAVFLPPVLADASLLQLTLLGGILLTDDATRNVALFPSLHLSALVIGWLTLVAQCIWFGGLACVGTILLPDMESDWDEDVIALIEILHRATPWIGSAIGVTLVGMLFFSEASIRGTASGATFLLSDPSGQTLLIELILFVPLVILSLYALIVPPVKRQQGTVPEEKSRDEQVIIEQAERNVRRPIRLFLWVAGGILLCSALLSFWAQPSFPPATTGTTVSFPMHIRHPRQMMTLPVLSERSHRWLAEQRVAQPPTNDKTTPRGSASVF